jgi:hypothetical protein
MLGTIESQLGWPSPGGATAITATGNASQANAFPLTAAVNIVSTVTATTNSVRLPNVGQAGAVIVVKNTDSTDSLNVYPHGTAAAKALAATRTMIFISTAPNTWITVWGAAA